MADKPFRVLLDLTDLHIESFKYVWIYVSPREVKTIADFKLSLLHKIKLGREDIKLFVRDGLLLDGETIMVLREDDTVKVQFDGQLHPVQEDAAVSSKENKKSSRKRCLDEWSQENTSSNSKKRSKYSVSNQDDMHKEGGSSKAKKKRKSNKSVPYSDNEEMNNNVEVDGQKSVDVCGKQNNKKSIMSNEINVVDNRQSFDSSFLFETARCSTSRNNITFEVSQNTESSDFIKSKSKGLVIVDKPLNLKGKVESNQQEFLKVDTGITAESSSGFKNICPKKKRKRRRKRKTTAETVLVTEEPRNANFDSEFKSFMNIDDTCTKRKHNIFTSPPRSVAGPLCQGNTVLVQISDEDDNQKNQKECADICLVEEISIIDVHPQGNYPKMSTPAQSNGYSNPNWRVTVMQNENSDFTDHKSSSPKRNLSKSRHEEICASPVKCSAKDETSYEKKYENFPPLKSLPETGAHIAYKHKTSSPKRNLSKGTHDEVCESPVKCPEKDDVSCEKKYENFPPLKSLPEIGAHIAYKVLELDESYSPSVSEFREGIIMGIDPSTEEMNIEFLKHEIKPGRTGKFENLKDNELPPPEVRKAETVSWSELIEPKLLS